MAKAADHAATLGRGEESTAWTRSSENTSQTVLPRQTENEQEDTSNPKHMLDKAEEAEQRACNIEAMLCSSLHLSSSSSYY